MSERTINNYESLSNERRVNLLRKAVGSYLEYKVYPNWLTVDLFGAMAIDVFNGLAFNPKDVPETAFSTTPATSNEELFHALGVLIGSGLTAEEERHVGVGGGNWVGHAFGAGALNLVKQGVGASNPHLPLFVKDVVLQRPALAELALLDATGNSPHVFSALIKDNPAIALTLLVRSAQELLIPMSRSAMFLAKVTAPWNWMPKSVAREKTGKERALSRAAAIVCEPCATQFDLSLPSGFMSPQGVRRKMNCVDAVVDCAVNHPMDEVRVAALQTMGVFFKKVSDHWLTERHVRAVKYATREGQPVVVQKAAREALHAIPAQRTRLLHMVVSTNTPKAPG